MTSPSEVDLAAEAKTAWAGVDANRISQTWQRQVARLLVILAGAQRVAADQADDYLDDVLDVQRIDNASEARVATAALTGVASDGRDLASLLYQPAITALTGIQRGAGVARSMAGGSAVLDMIVRTQVADAGRVADQVATVTRPRAAGYVRMLVGKSCSRCAVLAGRWYAVNTGFKRHPRCDCIHIPGRENITGDERTDPKAFFRSLSPAEQDRVFTKAGAESIRLGADIGQVVNARRGAAGLTTAGARITAEEAKLLRGGRQVGRLETRNVFGQQLFVTTEGTTARGTAGVKLGAKVDGVKTGKTRYRSARPPRLMPESILQIAGTDRAEALRLLKRFGYLT
jgi:hypothetical protein